ncbi:tripartite tricarboxylate transporter substrate binding protein [Phaeobacter sp. J2-8]|uniref:Bug family tripartite tricarboxylate transporter substrate binding protein n=1 Tax=Phaeobacter sp. J2-8 TaxID=2931394 RepID=UPI001FD3EAD3|nr:tripartite tricarboxylate transporter substrate binding protein [Phaeobacter sp. J2-8]MCJ7873266.1 tripartite tricarboxylate transporter substrate binding protein [Phaeobacter sp. J2-8]
MMKNLMTRLALTVALMFGMATAALAQGDWPSKPLTVVVTFGAGGNADLQTRLEAKYLEPILGVPIKVVNVPGGGHVPGVMSFLKGDTDGYTWMRFAPPSTVIAPLVRRAPYDPLTDFAPAWMNTQGSTVLYVRSDSPWTTLDEFIAAAQETDLVMGINNIGAPPHLSAVNLSNQFDVNFKMLAMKTIPASLTGLIGGQADAAIGQTTHVAMFPDELRPLVILDERKDYFDTHLPGVKTLEELHPGMTAGNWLKSGWTAKAGTDPAIIEKMTAAGKQVFENPDFQREFAGLSTLVPVYGTKEVLADIERGLTFYAPLLDSLGMLKK